MKARAVIPVGTPYMHNPLIVSECVNPNDPDLCPACGHVTMFLFDGTVLHDAGVVYLPQFTACGSEECADED